MGGALRAALGVPAGCGPEAAPWVAVERERGAHAFSLRVDRGQVASRCALFLHEFLDSALLRLPHIVGEVCLSLPEDTWEERPRGRRRGGGGSASAKSGGPGKSPHIRKSINNKTLEGHEVSEGWGSPSSSRPAGGLVGLGIGRALLPPSRLDAKSRLRRIKRRRSHRCLPKSELWEGPIPVKSCTPPSWTSLARCALRCQGSAPGNACGGLVGSGVTRDSPNLVAERFGRFPTGLAQRRRLSDASP